MGKRPGTIVLFGDILKGALATTFAVLMFRLDLIYADDLIRFRLLFGILAIFGHIFSVFLQFKGGKGVATLLGMTLAIAPEGALTSIVVFLAAVYLSKICIGRINDRGFGFSIDIDNTTSSKT